MRTIANVATDAAERPRRQLFGKLSLGLGTLLLIASTFLVISETAIALRIQGENLQNAERPDSENGLWLRFEIHHYGPVVFAYRALHIWVLWAVVCWARGRVVRYRSVGLALLASGVGISLAEHAIRAWLGKNGVHVPIPLEFFLPW
jgi:hypothetical protein